MTEIYKNNRGLLIAILIFFIISTAFFGLSYLKTIYPYIFIIMMMLIASLFDDKKIGLLIILLTLTGMVGIQFWYYGVVPTHENYAPITAPILTIFQTFGKFQVFYSPDIPQQGEIITTFVSICDNDLKNCTDISNYTISAYFYDESETKHFLLDNEIIKNNNFKLDYFGKPINIQFTYQNKTYPQEFMIPQPSWSQSIMANIPRHPITFIFNILSAILGLWTIKEIYTHLKRKTWKTKKKKKE